MKKQTAAEQWARDTKNFTDALWAFTCIGKQPGDTPSKYLKRVLTPDVIGVLISQRVMDKETIVKTIALYSKKTPAEITHLINFI